MTYVVIVESPAKCKTIHKYLGDDYTILASYGHIRDLPSKDGSVLPDEDFAMDYQISPDSTRHVQAITAAVKKADALILATDPDREGEAISWHVLEMLKAKKALPKGFPVQRVTFTSITRDAVREAIAHPRDLDMDLVNAQQARRALDYLVGFNISPVLWRKLPGSRSAGRVQSVALRLVCEREEEIEAFRAREYWSIAGDFTNKENKHFTARLTHLEGKKLDKFDLPDEKTARAAEHGLSQRFYRVAKLEKKQAKRYPKPPFTTSTLQQEAARKLGFSAKKTMQTAQKLYEGIEINGELTGLITYMRTDGTDIAPEAMTATRDLIKNSYGKDYLPESPRLYTSKQKNAQEAHEAIRPANPKLEPFKIEKQLNADEFKLYGLIWRRLISSQMEAVVLDQVIADLETEDHFAMLRAVGTTIRFDGFYKVYREGQDDIPEDDEEDSALLPDLSEGDKVVLQKAEASQHFTQPPPRYSEASLVKRLEELGIGRPSTYASILSVLIDREYVRLDKKRFFPEMRGRLVTAFLQSFFPHYVEYDFTANLEDELDTIAEGKLNWKEALRRFWGAFSACVKEAQGVDFAAVQEALTKVLEPMLFPGEGTLEERRKCPTCGTGRLNLRIGKYGPFLSCSRYPECKHTREVGDKATGEGAEGSPMGTEPKILGADPKTGENITLRKGPYGWYVQRGEAVKGEAKPGRASIDKGTNPAEVTLEAALGLLSLPREVGIHPETGKMIVANIGRYGPYLLYDEKYTNLKGDDDPRTIGLNRAVTVIAEPRGVRKGGAAALKTLGDHPDGGKIEVYEGKYGPYVKWGKINATLPKNVTPETVTVEQAVEVLAARAEKGGGKKGGFKKSASKSGTAKKPAPKKAGGAKKKA